MLMLNKSPILEALFFSNKSTFRLENLQKRNFKTHKQLTEIDVQFGKKFAESKTLVKKSKCLLIDNECEKW